MGGIRRFPWVVAVGDVAVGPARVFLPCSGLIVLWRAGGSQAKMVKLSKLLCSRRWGRR